MHTPENNATPEDNNNDDNSPNVDESPNIEDESPEVTTVEEDEDVQTPEVMEEGIQDAEETSR